MSNVKPLVSIRCFVYNHEPFLRQCLDGFIMQKTNFAFEAIVHDDASTDSSSAIIREYAEKYPMIIKPIYETENQYSKGDGSLFKIMNAAIHPDVKYIAICEGDDYWTDPYKLQKQFDFLESHPDYSLCFHNALVKWQKGEYPDSKFANIEKRAYSDVEILGHWIIPTASVLLRKEILFSDLYNNAMQSKIFCFGDIIMFLSASKFGKLYGMDSVMSVYRKHECGAVFKPNFNHTIRHLHHIMAIPKFFGNHLIPTCKRIVAKISCSNGITYFASGKKRDSAIFFREAFGYCPLHAFLYLSKRSLSFLKRKICISPKV